MSVQSFEKVNTRFRQLADQFCFSDRLDLDLSDFKSLLRENFDVHYWYFLDRLQKCTDIFWENGDQFWFNRFSFLFSLNEKNLIKNLEEYLKNRMFQIVKDKKYIDIRYDIEYLQFVEFCKVKHLRSENLLEIKNYLIDLPSQTKFEKHITLVQSFTPFLFKNLNDYAEHLTAKITNSTRNFDFLLFLEQKDVPLDRLPIAKLAYDLITERTHSDKNCLAFFYLISDKKIRDLLKEKYCILCKRKLISLLEYCDYYILDAHHFRNISNLLDLDDTLADDIVRVYAEKIYDRDIVNKTANINKLIKLAKICPQVSPRKILAFLSSNNKVPDIKYIVSAFPDLKKLAAFV
jgi:hypothetical protein